MSIGGTARGIIEPCQIESCTQLKITRLPMLRDGEGGGESFLGRPLTD